MDKNKDYMQNNDNTRKLYDALVADNYELGDYEKFTSDISNPEYMRKLYDTMVADDYELGEYNTFSSRYSVTPQSNAAQATQATARTAQPVVDAYGMPMQPEMSTIEDAPKVEEKPQTTQTATQPAQAAQTTQVTAQPAQPAQAAQTTQTAAKTETPWTAEMMALARQHHLKETGEDPIAYMPRGYRTGKTGSDDELLAAWYNETEDTRKQLWDKQAELDVADYKADRDAVYAEQGKWDTQKAKQWREKMMATYRIDPMQEIPETYRAATEQKWGKKGSDEAVLAAWLNEKENARQGQWNEQMQKQKQKYMEIMKPYTSSFGRKKEHEYINTSEGYVAATKIFGGEEANRRRDELNEQARPWMEAQKSWTPSSARRFREQTMEQTLYDPYAIVPEEYKALATQKWGKEGSEDAYFSAWMNLSPEEREAFVKREHIKSFFNEETANKMQGIRERALEEKGRGIAKSAMSPMGYYNNSAEAAMDRIVQDAGNVGTQTLKALDKAEEIKQAYKNHQLDENFFAGAYKGMKDGLTDIDNWTGLYMVGEMTNLYDIADKMEKGEALSQTEEDFLDAQAYKLAVEAALADDLGWGYGSGNVTGASVPFMLQMLASPMSGASGKAIDKGFAAVGRRAIDKFGKGILKKLLTKAPVKKVVKGLVGTVGKGIGQTILFGSDRVAAGTMERHLGNEMVAERANEEFNAGVQGKAGEDLGTAFFKAGVSTSMENISEFAGGAFIDDFTKMVGKKISKEFMDAMGGSVGRRMANAAARQNANKVFHAIANNKWGQHAVNLSKSVQNGMEWDGLLNEFLEEVLNKVSNVMIGDMSMEDFTSLEKNAETLLGLAWTSGFFTASNAASRIGGYARGNIALKRTDRAARQIFTGDMQEKWDAYTQALSQADGYEEVEQLYKGLVADISKNQDKELARAQMSEAAAYMTNYVKMMGMNAATEEADEGEQKTPAQKDIETAQGEGIAAQGTEEELDVVEEMDESYSQLAGHLEGTNVEDWLLQYGETAAKQLEAIRGSELDEQTKAMAEAYLTSTQRYEGLLLANQEEVDAIVDEAAKEFDANVNQELGSVIQVLTTQGKTAYVIQGNPNERENIRLRYEDGTTEPVSHAAIEKVLSQADANTMRSDMIEGVRKSAVAEVVHRMQGAVPNATQMQMPVGHNVVVDGQAGVVAGVNADGTMQIQMQGGNAVSAAPQQVMDAQAYNTIMERKARARESARVSVPVREEVAAPVAEEATAAEAVAEEAVAAEEELTEAQKLLQEYMDESVPLEDRQAILDNNLGKAKESVSAAKAEMEALEESKPKATEYTSIAEFKQAQEEWKAQMQEKQQVLDLAEQQEATWNEVKKGMVQPVETATEQTSAEAVPATPQVTEEQRKEAGDYNQKHDTKALAEELGISAKRIQRVIDFANQVGVKLNFANVTRTQGGKGAFTNADNMAKDRTITLSKYQLAKGMAIEWVMGHELTHQIKADGNAANWEAYKQAIINALGQDTFDKRVKEQSKVYREAGAYQDMSANEFVETMQEEVCADAAGDMLLNPDNMNKVMGVPQSLASRIWNSLKSIATFNLPTKTTQAISAWQQLAEGKELTGEGDGRERHSIVGTTGARALDKAEGTTVRMDNMDVAEEMETAGKDAETIWMATGWERGADGKWKYEVLEDFAYEEPRAKAERLQEEYQQVQNEKENIYRYLNRFPARGLTEQQKAIKKEQNARLKKLIRQGEQLQDEIIESRSDTTLGELIGTDNNIIKAYPELASMPVSFVENSRFMDAGLKGAFDGEGIWINPTLENTAPTLLHEVQHAIQRIEGFARGGNTGSVKTKADALRKDVRPLHEMMLDTPEWAERQRLQNRWFDETDAAEIAKIEQRVNEINESGVLDAIQSKRKQLQEKYGSDATVGKILGSPYAEDAEIWQQLPESFNDKYEAYRSLAGETEARNVSARLNMSEEERRQTRPGKTEDVAREEQIVLEDEGREEQGVKYSIPTQKPIGRSLAADEAEILITDMKENADITPELEFSIENWLSEFGKDGLVTTPIGKVKMGENQIAKLLNKNREKRFGLIRPTLQTPDVIIEKHAPAEGAERESKFLFIKTFVKPDGSRFIHFESVTVLKDGMDVSISSHEIGDKALRKEMQNGTILHLNSKLSSGFDKYLTKTPTERPDLAPTSDNRLVISSSLGGGVSPISHADDAAPAISLQSRNDDELSANKDTQSVSTMQTDKKEISEKSAESNVEVTNEEVMHSISPIEGYTYSEVIDMVQNDVENILSEEGADNVEAVEFWAHGSRMRGNAKEDSDLDVVMFYKGNEKEDSLFNLINEHELAIDGIKVDVNPIRISNEQDIARYKEKSARYDQEMRFNLAGGKRFSIANRNQEVFVSNAARAVEGIKQDKATPQQWLAMIEKNGGLKAGEDKWLGLSDWLKGLDKKSVTKQEILDFINENMIQIEEVRYIDRGDKHKIRESMSDEQYSEFVETTGLIDPMRLNYTTEGLDNKQEIALTVPTIEPWNQSDELHFGDAGEGRAVAWVRFGETTDAEGKRVLVIDEIQSKRHQEGREKGYESKEQKDADRRLKEYTNELTEKYGARFYTSMLPEERVRYNELSDIANNVQRGQIPEAPFDKNWHELAMKRMLRYAAENGFDKVAWTTGTQQAERYDLGHYINSLKSEEGFREDGSLDIYADDEHICSVDESGIVIDGDYKGRPLSDIVGVEPAKKLLKGKNATLTGNELHFGGEGMKGFYDKMLPSFMNKYGKKWGAKVGEVTLPHLEESAQHMWSVDVTPEMKESVMQGQVMFSLSAEEQNIVDTAKANGTYMKAPNGEPTNLNEKQWAQVRTKAFKEWFGDWENDPENASKIVDENGEPMVVYHGSEEDFNVFDKTKGRANMDIQGMFFTPWDDDARGYGSNVRAFYLNIRKPANESTGYRALKKFQGQNGAGIKAREYLVSEGYDGLNNEDQEFVAFDPTQIKSATDNVGTFDAENADIRYSMPARMKQLEKAENFIRRNLKAKRRGLSFEIYLPVKVENEIRKRMGRDFESHNITINGVAHGLNNHGVNGTKLTATSIPVTEENATLIPYIMVAPDRVDKGSTDASGRESVRFIKNLSNGIVVVVEKEYKNSPDDMETINIWADLSSEAINAQQKAAPGIHVQNAILDIDVAKIRKDAEEAIRADVEYLQKQANAKSGEQKYSLPARPATPKRNEGEGIMEYAQRVANATEAQKAWDVANKTATDIDRQIKYSEEYRDILAQKEPQTIEEAASVALAGGKLLWNDHVDGTKVSKGAKSMLGWGEGERQKFFAMFASKENGGVSVERMGEEVIEICSQYNIPVDETDAMLGTNAVLEVLQSAQRPSDITGYIEHNRIEQVRRMIEEEQELLASERNRAYMDMYGMTYDDFVEIASTIDAEDEQERSDDKNVIAWLYGQSQRQQERITNAQAELEQLKRNGVPKTQYDAAYRALEQMKAKVKQTQEMLDEATKELRTAKGQATRQRKANMRYKAKKGQWKQVFQKLREAINGKNIRSIDKSTLNEIMRAVGNADLSGMARLFGEAGMVEDIILGVNMRATQDRIDKLLATKTTALNDKGIATGKSVDASVQAILANVRKTLEGILHHDIENQIHDLRSQNWHIRHNALGNLSQEQQEQVDANKAKIEKLKAELSKELATNTANTEQAVNEQIEKLTEQIDNGIRTEEESAELMTTLALKRQMVAIHTSYQDTATVEALLRRKQSELRTSWVALHDGNTPQDKREEYRQKRKALQEQIAGLEAQVREGRQATLDAMQSFADSLEETITTGRASLKGKVQEQLQRRKEFVAKAIHDVNASGKQMQSVNEADKQENDKLPWYKRMFSPALRTFDYMLQKIATRTYGKDSWLYRQFMLGENGVMAAHDEYLRGMQTAARTLEDKAKEIFGKSYQDVMADSNRKKDIGIEILRDAEDYEPSYIPLKLTKGQATYIYMLWRMRDGFSKLATQGFTEEIMQRIEEYIGPDYIQWADWMQMEYLPMMREKYNARYREIYDTNMAAIDNYVPIRIHGQAIRKEVDLTDATVSMPGMQKKNGALIQRTVNVNPIDISNNIFELIGQHIDEMEEFYAYAPVRRDLQYILSSPAFRNLLNTQEPGTFQSLLEAARIATKTNQQPESAASKAFNDILNKLQKGLVSGNIAYRNMTAIKQVLSAPAFIGYSQSPVYLAILAKNMLGGYLRNLPVTMFPLIPVIGHWAQKMTVEETAKGMPYLDKYLGESFRWCMREFPDFRERVTRGSAGDIRLEEKGFSKLLDKYTELGMSANVFIDAVTVSVGLKSIYDYEMAKAAKRISKMAEEMQMDEQWTEEEMRKASNAAKIQATLFANQTQQSSNPALLSPMQVSKNFMERSLTLYKNSSLGLMRAGIGGMRNLLRYMKGKKARRRMIEEYTRMFMQEGFAENEAKKKAISYLNSEARKGAFVALLEGYAMNVIWNLGSKGLLGFMTGGGDDDDKERTIGEWVWDGIKHVVKNTFGSAMPFVNDALEGRLPAIGLTTSEAEKAWKDIKKQLDENGISLAFALTGMRYAAKFGGVDMQVWANTMDGYYRLFSETGNSDDNILALMLILNSPHSNRIAVARELYKGKSEEEFQRAIELAGRYNQPVWTFGREMTDKVESDMAKWYLSDNATDEEKQRMRYIEEMEERIDNLETVEDALEMFDEVSDTELRKKISSKIDQISKPEDTFAEKVDRKKENALAEDDTDMGGYTYMKMADSQDLLEEKRMRAEIDMLRPIVERQKDLFEEYGSNSAVYTRFMSEHGAEIRRYNTLKAYSRAIQMRKRKMDEEGADVQALYEDIKELYKDAQNI